ncbi:MAG TPA: methyltransferase domain-containing protein, partial [Bacillota bacterium]|nr:methyltransferase domain-containing protein [Bacillota bacterium]
MSDKEKDREFIRKKYAEIAMKGSQGCGCCSDAGCCGGTLINLEKVSIDIGYSIDELENVPAGANMGLGCGNPTAMASLRAGEVVLDLGCGGGFDCFLAANAVGPSGTVIGVDMT